MSRPDDRRPGARPAAKALAALPQACRTFLREALAAGGVPDTKHAASCAGCAERLSAALRIRSALLATPPLPAAMTGRAMLERVQERIVADAEASPLGTVLAQSLAAVPVPERQVEVADVPTSPLAAPLRQRLATPPPTVPPLAWGRVQASIVGRVRAEAVARRRVWPFGAAAGAAAAAVLLLMLLRDQPTRPPEIVFMDLAAPPNVDFAILRYGPPK